MFPVLSLSFDQASLLFKIHKVLSNEGRIPGKAKSNKLPCSDSPPPFYISYSNQAEANKTDLSLAPTREGTKKKKKIKNVRPGLGYEENSGHFTKRRGYNLQHSPQETTQTLNLSMKNVQHF